MFETASTWIVENWIELFGTITGLLYIWFSIKHSLWLWPIGFLTSAAYIIVFYQSKLFADMALQVYYVFASIYGWVHWVYGKQKSGNTGKLRISKLKTYQWIVAIIACVVLTLAYYPLGVYFNASFPIWDGFVTAGSIVATWMLTRKIVEQWLFWVIIDGATIALLVAKERYLTVILMTVYTIMAILGYLKWLKDYKAQQ
jgi:nicotinamide mononucleotide transporter